MKLIRQVISTECLFQTVATWIKAQPEKATLRIVSAFVSEPAIRSLEPFFDVFLSKKNKVELIFGIDLGGTGSAAVNRIHALCDAYNDQFRAWVWDAKNPGTIFHPKLFLIENGDLVSGVIGSGNLTLGGLANNLESVFEIKNVNRTNGHGKQLIDCWKMFRYPTAPLKPEFLKELDSKLLKNLLPRLPKRSTYDSKLPKNSHQRLWTPLSRVPLPDSTTPPKDRTKTTSKPVSSFLLMDIMNETRGTQVQPPGPVWERFFGVVGKQPATLHLQISTTTGLSQPINRLVVTSGYMRRIEIPQIHGLPRPCGIVFVKLQGKQSYAYRILRRGTPGFKLFDKTLQKHGESPRTRRFLIGNKNSVANKAASDLINHKI